MCTKMTENDYELALEVFRTCLPAVGAKAKNDRLFLEALHYFTLHNISWRALPERFGNWNSVWKRFDRLGKAGVFEDYFPFWLGLMKALILSLCSTAPSFAPMYLQQALKGAGMSSARPVSWRVRNQNPSENRPKWSAPWL